MTVGRQADEENREMATLRIRRARPVDLKAAVDVWERARRSSRRRDSRFAPMNGTSKPEGSTSGAASELWSSDRALRRASKPR